MFDRKLTRVALLSAWVLSGHAAFAQDDPEAARIRAQQEAAQRAAEQRRAAELEKQERERGTKMLQEFLKDGHVEMSPITKAALAREERNRALRRNQFRSAFEEFEAAREDLSAALGFKAKLKNPGQKIAKSTVVFLDFIKRISKERPRLNASEFKDFTPSELGWEALTTAERISPHLAAVMLTENDLTVDVRLMKSLAQLQAELLRLQWMAQRLK